MIHIHKTYNSYYKYYTNSKDITSSSLNTYFSKPKHNMLIGEKYSYGIFEGCEALKELPDISS